MPGTQVNKNVWPDERVLDFFTALRDRNFVLGGLAIDTDKTQVKTVNTVTYALNGKLYTKAAFTKAFTATTHDIAADASTVQEAIYLYSLDASGNITCTMGAIASGAGNAVPPATPANQAPVAALRLAVAAGATSFDATTDELDEAHLTDTYYDLTVNPADYDSSPTL